MRLSDDELRALTVECLGCALARGLSFRDILIGACEREDEIRAEERVS